MTARGIELSWDETVPAYLVKKGYSTVYGARNLRRLIQKEVEDTVAVRIVEARGSRLEAVRLHAEEDGIRCETGEKLLTEGKTGETAPERADAENRGTESGQPAES